MIKNITGNRESCEDIAQDVFLAAYKKLASFDTARSNFSTWLFTIARNKSISALRKKRPLSTSELPEKINPRTPLDAAAEKELFVRLDRKLQALPPKQKTALVLAEFEKLSYREIAQIEGTRVGTIKSRINRAKNKLRSALGDLDGDIL
jgi:RNA polymerase sigma-70 factor (ECF subfamily)